MKDCRVFIINLPSYIDLVIYLFNKQSITILFNFYIQSCINLSILFNLFLNIIAEHWNNAIFVSVWRCCERTASTCSQEVSARQRQRVRDDGGGGQHEEDGDIGGTVSSQRTGHLPNYNLSQSHLVEECWNTALKW